MKILVAVDGSPFTRRMLAFLAAHNGWLGAQHSYTVLYCVAPLPHRAAAFADKPDVQALYREDAENVLKPVRAFFQRRGLTAQFAHRIGPAASTIARLAEQQRFDLVVLGTHGRGALAGLVLGSVATKVLSLCRTPVLLVR